MLFWTVYLLAEDSPKELAKLGAITPGSHWASTGIAKASSDWTRTIQPDRPGRSFAAFQKGGVLNPLMIGLPTEDAWDRFQSALI